MVTIVAIQIILILHATCAINICLSLPLGSADCSYNMSFTTLFLLLTDRAEALYNSVSVRIFGL